MTADSRITVADILLKKKHGQKITMLTAYDYPLASLVDKAGIDIILVGDSLANVVLGLESTREVGMEEMIHHTKAVNRAVKRALLVGDMPFGSHEKDIDLAISNAGRFSEEAGCAAVKLEWFENCPETAEAIIKSGIPVMGHIGLTPQAVTSKDGFRVQGKDADSAKRILQEALELERRGCFSIVLECLPQELTQIITRKLKIPTIGIGAGPFCDGQVLVIHDILGLFDRYKPKFVKKYADVSSVILQALTTYRDEVLSGVFPSGEQSFSIPKDQIEKLLQIKDSKQ